MGSVTRGYGALEGFLARRRSAIANRLIPFDRRNGRLLDIGCGCYPFFLINTVFREKVGIDRWIDSNLVKHPLNTRLHLLKWDYEQEGNLPFGSESFDVVTMLAVFEHVSTDRISALVSDIYRVLKRGGYYIVTTPAGWTDLLLRALALIRLVSPEEIFDHKDKYTHGKIAKILEDVGFSQARIRFGYFEFFMNIWCISEK